MRNKFYKSYFFKTIALLTILVVFIAAFNFTIDPEKIYTSKKNLNKNELNLEEKLNKLILERGFLVYKDKNWNDRDLYNLFSKRYKDKGCIVFGASSVVSISVVQNPRVLDKYCNSLLNLGMPGATFEDYFALSNNFSPSDTKKKKIFLSIHPFTLNFNKDNRWVKNSESYYEFIENIKFETKKIEKNKTQDQFFSKSIKNLFSYEYFKTSLKIYLKKDINENYITTNLDGVNLEKTNVILFDGSKKKRELDKNSKNVEIDLNTINYKISLDKLLDEDVLNLLLKYKKYFEKNSEIIFLLTPYHPDVFKLKNEPIFKAIEIVETVVHEFSRTNQIDVVGSFNPNKMNCAKHEFFDASHPSNKCLKRLEKAYFSYSK